MNEYELMLLTAADLDDAGRTAVIDRAKDAVAKGGGTWVGIDEWGRRKMAYEINKQPEAHYSVLNIDATGDGLREVVRQLRITEGVVRVMAVDRVRPMPEGVTLEEVSDEEHAAGPPQRGRGGRGGRGGGGGRGRDRDRD